METPDKTVTNMPMATRKCHMEALIQLRQQEASTVVGLAQEAIAHMLDTRLQGPLLTQH